MLEDPRRRVKSLALLSLVVKYAESEGRGDFSLHRSGVALGVVGSDAVVVLLLFAWSVLLGCVGLVCFEEAAMSGCVACWLESRSFRNSRVNTPDM